jgi:nucleoside-diphosphate-sugar epimerase
MTVLVTGAAGFVGVALVRELYRRGKHVRAAVRIPSPVGTFPSTVEEVVVGSLELAAWDTALQGVDCVVHCAARAHVMHDKDGLPEFRRVNVEGSQRLALAAATNGARRFVLISSIGVLGTHTDGRGPFDEGDVPAPTEDYAVSKLEAEIALRDVANASRMELVIVRPPLVYGPGAKGNIERLAWLVQMGVPIPFGSVRNQRSMVGLDNLVDMLILCIDHPRATEAPVFLRDGEDLSICEWMRRMQLAVGKSPLVIPVPQVLIRVLAKAIGKSGEVDRLLRNLIVDDAATRARLGWSPPVTVNEGICRIFSAIDQPSLKKY